MAIRRCAANFIAMVCAGVSALHADPPTRYDRPNTEHSFVSLHYPKGFDPGKSYHVLYWFHGTGGQPNPGIARAHGSYIGIGMSYLKREHVPPGKYGAAHWDECQEVRKLLEQDGLKLRRDMVAGMSKGGWASFYLAAEVPDGPDAIAIFAAGKDPRYKKAPPMPKALSVMVGTGETDPNYPQAQLAVGFFREGGAGRVTYEEWLGKGHTYMASPRVVDWLQVESLKDRPAELTAYATRQVARELKRCDETTGLQQRYLALRFLVTHPALPHASELLQQRVRDSGRAAGAEPELKGWLDAFNASRTLVAREAGFFNSQSFDVPKLDKLVGRFRTLTESAPGPGLAARAAHGTRRAQKMAEIYKAQKKAFETPEFKKLGARYRELQKLYADAKGEPGDEVMQELKEVGAKLGDLRHKASMGAFRDAEWGREPEPDPLLDGAIEADPGDQLRPYLGAGF